METAGIVRKIHCEDKLSCFSLLASVFPAVLPAQHHREWGRVKFLHGIGLKPWGRKEQLVCSSLGTKLLGEKCHTEPLPTVIKISGVLDKVE